MTDEKRRQIKNISIAGGCQIPAQESGNAVPPMQNLPGNRFRYTRLGGVLENLGGNAHPVRTGSLRGSSSLDQRRRGACHSILPCKQSPPGKLRPLPPWTWEDTRSQELRCTPAPNSSTTTESIRTRLTCSKLTPPMQKCPTGHSRPAAVELPDEQKKPGSAWHG